MKIFITMLKGLVVLPIWYALRAVDFLCHFGDGLCHRNADKWLEKRRDRSYYRMAKGR